MDDSSDYTNGPEDSEPKPDKLPGDWDSDEALEFLKMERSVHSEESNEDMAKRLLREAAPNAALSIIQIGRNSANDNTRLAANKYIMDFVRDVDGTGEETWEGILGDVVKKAEDFANGGQV